jgi:NADH:ubiquinone oxidoreductase subunit 6 (subunit J)
VSPDVAGFWAFAIVLTGSALAVVLGKNLFHSVLWLALALTGTAGIFLLLEAEFIAGVQILLYAGGVVTVVVFAIVVTERLVGEKLSHTSRNLLGGAVVATAFAFGVITWVSRTPLPQASAPMHGDVTRGIGMAVLTRYVLPFELVGVILLVALLAASYFARPEE